MKILVLNGSPKRDKSDTMHITRAFLDGMKEAAPQDIHIIHTIDQHIDYCTGCFSCMRNGGTCIHNDDMKAILEEILDSDLLIWSFPLYCYGMPAPLKALLDRTLPLSSDIHTMKLFDEAVSQIPDVRVIGHITPAEQGRMLVSRDGQEFELKAQGWNNQ